MRALGIDVGTTNIKVALVDADGGLVASAHRPLHIDRADDTAEQDHEAVWAALVDAVRELAPGAVGAIGVCGQYSSIVPLDANARAVAPMLMWQDKRGTDHSFAILRRHEDAFMTFCEHHGLPPVGGGLSLAHLLYYQLDRPDVHARTAAYVEVMDAVTARMSGTLTATQHSTFMFQLCDNRSLAATEYDDTLVKLSGIDPTRLPPLIRVDDAVGVMRPEVAAELGLAGTPTVYAGTNDTATVAVAGGAFRPGVAALAIGTTSVLVDGMRDFRSDLAHQLLSMPGPYTDRYVLWAENGMGGKLLEYLLANVVYAADALGDHRTADPFATLDAALVASRPGAGGVLFLPWLGGAGFAPQGDEGMRGGFVHMSLQTTRVDLVRAVAEGVAHNLGWLLPHAESFTGQPIEAITFVGGAARSGPWCQVLADVLERPVVAPAQPGTIVARGAALLALERAGARSRDDVEAEPTGPCARYEPNPETRSLYAGRQAQFEAAYAALLPISEALS